ncbi:MAG: hypothetical protein GXO24_02690 [Chlorobi bacterium]|nr:hypothetical protein [Chlorobiota bacterium]
MKKILFTVLFIGWAGTRVLHAQYDVNQLTVLYEQSLEARAYTDRLMLDWILKEQAINPVDTRKKWKADRQHFLALLDTISNKVPSQSDELVKQAEKLRRKSEMWMQWLINAESNKSSQVKQLAKWYKITVDAEEQFIRTLQKYLGMDEQTLSHIDNALRFYSDAQRAFGSYLLQHKAYRSAFVSKGFAEGNGSDLFDKALSRVKKLFEVYGKDPGMRRQLKSLYADLVFFKQAVDRRYDPRVFYTSFDKFNRKFDRFVQDLFKNNKWI